MYKGHAIQCMLAKDTHIYATLSSQAQPGLSYAPATGTVLFEDDQSHAFVRVNLESQRFLAINSTFTVSIDQVNFVGSGGKEGLMFLRE